MAVVSKKNAYVFLLHPRTGCTAIANGALIPDHEGYWLPEKDLYRSGKLIAERKHTTVDQLINASLIDAALLDQVPVIVGVRNPFDSLMSLYHKIVTRYSREVKRNPNHFFHRNQYALKEIGVAVEDGVSRWVRYRYWNRRKKPPTHFGAKWVEDGDVFIRFENLENDLNWALKQLGRPRSEIPKINVTGRPRGWQEHFDTQTKELIEEVFAPTFERFGYSFYDDEM